MGCTFIKSKKQHQLESLDSNLSTHGSQRALAKRLNVNNNQRKEKFKIHLNPIVMRRNQQNRKITRIDTA